LDVYVGPLTRYWLGDWETIVQQIGRERGFNVEFRRPNALKEGWLKRLVARFRPAGAKAAIAAVRHWRDRVRGDLRLPDLDWSEGLDVEYETDKPSAIDRRALTRPSGTLSRVAGEAAFWLVLRVEYAFDRFGSVRPLPRCAPR